MKLRSNYFYCIRVIFLGLLFSLYFGFNILTRSINDFSERIFYLSIYILFGIGILLIVYGLLKMITTSVKIDKKNLIIKYILKKEIIVLTDISSVTNILKKSPATGFWGRNIVEIRTISRTYKITSDDYKDVEKLGVYLKKEIKNEI